ncbi:MAG TPA: RodZ domain-containing protein [Steroidobacteraceae bacterium]|nr:RodZ domain-containing protein [Steroidobacteraceae bacterium]
MSDGIGARLRGARERSRLTIMQAAERLHLDAEVLEALETENFAALGAPVYVKGHLRHYAELVGESAEALFDLYSQGTRVPQPDLTRIPKAAPDDTGRLIAPAVAVIVLFAVAGAVWWGLSLTHWYASVAVARPVVPGASSGPEAARLGTASRGPTELTPGTVSGTASAAGLVAVASPSAAKRLATSAIVPWASAAPQGQIQAALTYSGDSWTEVYDATGRRLLYGLSTGPATRRIEGIAPLSVVLGDASGVTLEVAGRPASIARFVRSDHIARFMIAADGRVLAAPRKTGG